MTLGKLGNPSGPQSFYLYNGNRNTSHWWGNECVKVPSTINEWWRITFYDCYFLSATQPTLHLCAFERPINLLNHSECLLCSGYHVVCILKLGPWFTGAIYWMPVLFVQRCFCHFSENISFVLLWSEALDIYREWKETSLGPKSTHPCMSTLLWSRSPM